MSERDRATHAESTDNQRPLDRSARKAGAQRLQAPLVRVAEGTHSALCRWCRVGSRTPRALFATSTIVGSSFLFCVRRRSWSSRSCGRLRIVTDATGACPGRWGGVARRRQAGWSWELGRALYSAHAAK